MANRYVINSMADVPVGAIIETRNGSKSLNMGLKHNTDWSTCGQAEYITLDLKGSGFQTFTKEMTTYGCTTQAMLDDDFEIVKIYVTKFACFDEFKNEDLLLIWEKETSPIKKEKKSKFNRGDKFEIEISEVHTHYDDNGKPFSLYRVKGYSTLLFDDKGLERLKKIEKENE